MATPVNSYDENTYPNVDTNKPFVPPVVGVTGASALKPQLLLDESELKQVPETQPNNLPNECLLTLDDVVVKSTLQNNDQTLQMKNVLEAFNQGRPSIMEPSVAFGQRIERNQYRLVHRNNTPELVGFTDTKLRMKMFATGTTETIGVYSQTDLLIGAHGSYLVNVPKNNICKAFKANNVPVFLGEGPHVIHSNTFNLDPKDALVQLNDPWIKHGTYNILRVPKGKIAKIWLNNEPYLLESRVQPYIFNTQFFSLAKTGEEVFVNTNSPWISHGTYHVIRVPKGKIAKIWLGNEPYFLDSREQPYIFNTAYFKLQPVNANEPFEDANSPWISHGTYNILRVPKGKIAKVWLGNEPYLLASREQPYIFNTPYFKLQPTANSQPFENAAEEIITHGSIKRIIPKTGNVAITYNSGKLEVYEPSINNEPLVITSENHVFAGFISTSTQTIEFPSKETKELRRKENPKDNDIINYEEFRTKDGLPIGVKLLVAYSVFDPVRALTRLKKDQIESHIEKLVVADMGAVVQRCSSSDFQNTAMTKTMPYLRDELMNSPAMNNDQVPPANNPQLIVFLQDSMKNKLSEDFKEYGIELIRVNIETPKILDKTIAGKIAENSVLTSETNARESLIDQRYKIAKKEAEQAAIQIEIKQNQENQNKINAARAALESARLHAEAKMIEAEAEAKAATKIAEAQAKLFETYPHLYQFEMFKLHATSLGGIRTTVLSYPDAQSMFAFGKTFFPANSSDLGIDSFAPLSQSSQLSQSQLQPQLQPHLQKALSQTPQMPANQK